MNINQEVIESIYTDINNSKMKINSYAVILDNIVSSGLTLSKIELEEYLLTLALDLKQASQDIEKSINKLEV